MAGVPAGLPAGVRVSDHISLGVIARAFPPDRVRQVLAETGKASERERDLPAQVMVYYAIAMALYMGSSTREVLRCLLEGLRWLWGADAVKVAGKSGISQARSRLGEMPLRRLYEQVVQPVATRTTKGAWYRTMAAGEPGWVQPGCGRHRRERHRVWLSRCQPRRERVPAAPLRGAWWKTARTCCSVPNWAVMRTARRRWPMTWCRPSSQACCAWPTGSFFGYALWRTAAATGADLLWRVKSNLRLPRTAVLEDGSYLSVIYPSEKDRRHATNGIQVRVVEYRLEGVADAEPLYRLVTTIGDPAKAPATDLAALYHERWEIEGALAELKTQLRGARVVLRSKTADLVRQEFWGLLLAHFAVRGLMHEAALRADEDPDRLSFLHAVRVVRRKLPLFAAFPPSGQARPA